MNNNQPAYNIIKKFVVIRFAVMALILFSFSVSCCHAADKAAPPSVPEKVHLVSFFDGGKLYSSGKFHVLELSVTYRQMGRQYGRLIPLKINNSQHLKVDKANGKK